MNYYDVVMRSVCPPFPEDLQVLISSLGWDVILERGTVQLQFFLSTTPTLLAKD